MKNKYWILLIFVCLLMVGGTPKVKPLMIDVIKAKERQSSAAHVPNYCEFAENHDWVVEKTKWADSVLAENDKRIAEEKAVKKLPE